MSDLLRHTSATLIAIAFATAAQAGGSFEKSFYVFEKNIDGAGDGIAPSAGLIADSNGNLYGTTLAGGAAGEGTVFKIAPDRSETILHSFTGGADGYSPEGGVIRDAAGNLYGTTSVGGSSNKGTIFKITPDAKESVLYAFTGGADGGNPMGTLIADAQGNLYGTASSGGDKNKGVVFKFSAGGTQSVLYSFAGGSDGASPHAGLIMDDQGNLYGTTLSGGKIDNGTVFKVTPSGVETVLHRFTGGDDGFAPMGELLADNRGSLYGTTKFGGTGSADCQVGIGCGTVFSIAPGGKESILHSFVGGQDGKYPSSRLIMDGQHNLYGTTEVGGKRYEGVVFKIARDGTETILHSFDHRVKRDGTYPSGPLLADPDFRHLYGETSSGGTKQGVVYLIRP